MAPSLRASTTFCFCPAAVIISALASLSYSIICARAPTPSRRGIVISRVTMSGLSLLYSSTASSPSAASPTTAYPLSSRSARSILRISMESSTISTPALAEDISTSDWVLPVMTWYSLSPRSTSESIAMHILKCFPATYTGIM